MSAALQDRAGLDHDRLREAVRLEICRRQLLPFIKHVFPGEFTIYPETQLVARALEAFEQSVKAHLSPRLLIIEPPRVGKSELASRQFPAWVLGRNPDWYFGLVSYGDDFAWELSAETRRIVMDEPYAQIFGASRQDDPTETVEVDPVTKAVKHWKLKDRRGGVRAAGINGSLTGKGYQIVVFDDPTKGRREADSRDYREDQWAQFKGTFYPRVEPGGGIIVVGTAWHIDDLIGKLQRENVEREADSLADHWEIIHIPAQALPGRVDLLGRAPGEWMGGRRTPAEWEHLKANVNPREWSAQYLGIPTPDEGQIFHPYEQFLFADPPTLPDADDEEYRGPRYGFSDTSHARNRQSDYSAVGVFQVEPNQTLGILDMFRGRVQYPELKVVAQNMYAQWKLWGLVIEDYSAGRALAQEFKRNVSMRIGTYRPDRDKYARAHAATGELAPNGTWRIRLPTGDRFPSGLPIRTFLDELIMFQPGGDEHDDMVDVFTMAVILICVRNYEARRKMRSLEFAFG